MAARVAAISAVPKLSCIHNWQKALTLNKTTDSGLAGYFRSSFEDMGGSVSLIAAYTSAVHDFSGILSAVAAADPEGVMARNRFNSITATTTVKVIRYRVFLPVVMRQATSSGELLCPRSMP
jgi:hypothetical protein